MPRRIALYTLLLVFNSFIAQDKGYLEFTGRCVKDNVPLKGAVLTIYKGGTKATDITTGKNGKFSVYLDFVGQDYKVVFNYPGCPEIYLMIYASKCPTDKEIFPEYFTDVEFFDYGRPTMNYANFKNPWTKIIYEPKKGIFVDDEAYATDFLENLYIDVEAIKRREEQVAQEKLKKELEAKTKLEAEEKEKQQSFESQRKAQQEAERLKKQLEEKARMEKENEAKNSVTNKESDSKESMVSEEINLTLEKERKNIKEKQNKAIKATYENDLLRIVATNERKTKENEYVKRKDNSRANEVIETLKYEAETKAKSEQVMFDAKKRSKQVVLNRRVKNQEMISLIKQTAYNDRGFRSAKMKEYPEAKKYKPPGLIAITTDFEQGTFKSIYTVTVMSGNKRTVYRKEKFSWGLIYYYKDNKKITDEQYRTEVSIYNVAL